MNGKFDSNRRLFRLALISLLGICIPAGDVAAQNTEESGPGSGVLLAQLSRRSSRSSSFGGGYGYNNYGNYSNYGSSYGSQYGSRLGSSGSRSSYGSSRRSSLSDSGQYGSGSSGYNSNMGYDQGYGSSRYSDRYNRSSSYGRRTPTGEAGLSGTNPTGAAGQQQGQQTEETTARSGRTKRTSTSKSGSGSRQSEQSSVEIEGAAAPKSGAPGVPPPKAAGRGRPAAPAAPKQEGRPQSQLATLFLTVNADEIIVGDVFSVDIELSNPKRVGYNRLAAVFRYDPVFLRPVVGPPSMEGESPQPALAMIDDITSAPAPKGVAAVAEKAPSPYLREAFSRDDKISLYQNIVDHEKGLISYMFEITGETSTAQGRVASIYFEALQPTQRTQLEFYFSQNSTGGKAEEGQSDSSELGTGLYLNDKDCLGLPLLPGDGTISRWITILSEKPTKDRVRSLDKNKVAQEEVYRTHLRLVPDVDQIVIGDEFDVRVELENPDHEQFDQVSLLIAYNPRVLEVVDNDQNNIIARGLNIHDGSYRDQFPFDLGLANKVDPEKGLIDYRVRGYRKPLRSEGTLASIRFRALKSTSKTTLRVFLDREGKDPTTGLFFRLQDVLGDTSDPTDGVSTCSMQIGRLRSVAAQGTTANHEGS